MSELKKYANLEALSEGDRELLAKAIETREHAYAPYSRFRVGAAVLLANDIVVTGNNQENAVYPTGLCAERVAIFAAHANYPDQKIKAVAITCRHSDKETAEPRTSCGGCRQAMLEYELKQESDFKILFYGEAGEVWEVPSAKSLLPWHFDSSAL